MADRVLAPNRWPDDVTPVNRYTDALLSGSNPVTALKQLQSASLLGKVGDVLTSVPIDTGSALSTADFNKATQGGIIEQVKNLSVSTIMVIVGVAMILFGVYAVARPSQDIVIKQIGFKGGS